MKVYALYKQVWDKAVEVQEALHAIRAAWTGSKVCYKPEEIIEYFSTRRQYAFEAELQKDTRRHVKLLYADYCTLRDELIALLDSDVEVVQK